MLHFFRYSDDPELNRATLIEHIEELRGRIMRVVLYLALGTCIGWFFAIPLYDLLTQFIKPLIPKTIDYREPFSNITQPFMLHLRLAFAIGVTLTLPLTLFELWGFVAPGLKPNERKPFKRVVPASFILFGLGIFVCWITLPAAMSWFLSYVDEFPGKQIYQEPGTLVFFVIKMLLAFGIGFQLPIIVFFLAKIGIISSTAISKYWRHAVVAVFVLSGALTPSNDIFSMLMMAVPLTILFMGSLAAVKLTNRNKSIEGHDELNDLD